jgi:hydroxymethylbilane synthase
VETVIIRAEGDRRPETPIAELEGEGWFTGELERALLEGRADVAVHSAKDLPSQLAEGLLVIAHLERGDCRDALVSRDGAGLEQLAPGAVVGTSSPRRAAMLGALRPDLRAVPIRGNVDTRLAKLDRGEVDALLLACAGLDRLGQGGRIAERLDPAVLVPAPAQGAVALQVVAGSAAATVCAAADHRPTSLAVTAERAVLRGLGGGCRLPVGAVAWLDGDRLDLVAALVAGGAIRRVEMTGDAGAAAELGAEAASRLAGSS